MYILDQTKVWGFIPAKIMVVLSLDIPFALCKHCCAIASIMTHNLFYSSDVSTGCNKSIWDVHIVVLRLNYTSSHVVVVRITASYSSDFSKKFFDRNGLTSTDRVTNSRDRDGQ